MTKCFKITFVCLSIVLLLSALLALLRLETFTINDFYSKHYNDVSIPTSFYNITAQVVPNHYTVEMKDKFFEDILEKNVVPFRHVVQKTSSIEDEKTKQQLLQQIDAYLLKLLNSKLASDEIYMFHTVFSQTQNITKFEESGQYVVSSDHLIYRDTKIYGVSISLKSVVDSQTGKVSLISYTLNGYVFEDKITDYQPNNLVEDVFQDYKKDNIIIKDAKYEKQYLCKYYADLKKFRGIVNMDDLQC